MLWSCVDLEFNVTLLNTDSCFDCHYWDWYPSSLGLRAYYFMLSSLRHFWAFTIVRSSSQRALRSSHHGHYVMVGEYCIIVVIMTSFRLVVKFVIIDSVSSPNKSYWVIVSSSSLRCPCTCCHCVIRGVASYGLLLRHRRILLAFHHSSSSLHCCWWCVIVVRELLSRILVVIAQAVRCFKIEYTGVYIYM